MSLTKAVPWFAQPKARAEPAPSLLDRNKGRRHHSARWYFLLMPPTEGGRYRWTADAEQLKLLRKGAQAWNAWRESNSETPIFLRSAQLRSMEVIGLDLSGANLTASCLIAATIRTSVTGDDPEQDFASLAGSSLMNASMAFTTLVNVNMQRADLHGALLVAATFNGCDLAGTDFTGAHLGSTTFSSVDLSKAIGLTDVHHRGPSSVDIATLRKSNGQIPPDFLRRCGFSELEIVMARLYDRSLGPDEITDLTYQIDRLRGLSPIQINPVFISYSHRDDEFVAALEPLLNRAGIRYWRDVHKLVAGRLDRQIEMAIRLNPTVVLILSNNSVNSDWVEWEAIRARTLEKELCRDVLCPIALDDSWETCNWEGPLRSQITKYNILNFGGWTIPKTLEGQFEKLLKGLNAFYKPLS